jgi:predicted TIM-barrel fold metal-dependent hydrolase
MHSSTTHPAYVVQRRDFLLSMSAASILASLPIAAGDVHAEESVTDHADADHANWIDAHVHVWTPDTTRYPLAPGFRPEEMAPRSFTPDQLLAHAKPHGVRRIVLIQMSYYGTDNRYMLDAIRDYPGVFSGVAIVEEDAQSAERMRALKPQGVRGFRLQPRDRAPEQWLAGDAMHAMWRCGAQEGLAMCLLINPEYLPSVAAMCRQFPDTPIVIDHFARIGIDGTIRSADLDNLCGLAEFPRTYVKLSAFYALGKKEPPYHDLVPMIRQVVEAFGPDRLMWATDCPYQVQENHTYAGSLALVKSGLDFLDANQRRAILHDTAARLFFDE